ncbi:MAG: DUF2799 domain-containing protein [Parvularculaceae bacterium]
MRRALVFLLAAAAGGCASMSKEECRLADWQAIGYEDGARGAPGSAISARREICAKKANVAPDMDAYLVGRAQGLEIFCRPSSGFELGARGGSYQGVCMGESEYDFAAAYRSGEQLFQLTVAANSAAAAVERAHHDLAHVRGKITKTEAALISPTTPMDARVDMLVRLKELSEEKGRIEASIMPLGREHERAEAELADYRAFLAVEGPYPDQAMRASNASY